MPSRKRNNHYPVCYLVTSKSYRVSVSNQFTAKIIYQLWCQLAIKNQSTTTVTVTALMSPSSYGTWGKKHIIQLLNGMWKERLVAKSIIKQGIQHEQTANAQFKLYGDEYEWTAIDSYEKLPVHIATSLTNALMYPQILQIILRAPTALAAHLALKVEGLTHYDDETRITNIKEVWNYLHHEVKRL